jgi:sulfur carrier protein ThiS
MGPKPFALSAHEPLPMKITFKLYASLTQYLPPEARRDNRITLDVADDTTLTQIIEPLGMPPKLVHLVLVNGVYIQPDDRATRTLVEGDVLAIWPPVAGG